MLQSEISEREGDAAKKQEGQRHMPAGMASSLDNHQRLDMLQKATHAHLFHDKRQIGSESRMAQVASTVCTQPMRSCPWTPHPTTLRPCASLWLQGGTANRRVANRDGGYPRQGGSRPLHPQVYRAITSIGMAAFLSRGQEQSGGG
jgi:hypothetical protein